MDTDKYNPIKKEISNDNNTSSTNTGTDKISGSEFGSWQDSAPVLRLSAYLRENRAAGIRLCKSDVHPSLIFDPPIVLADMQTDRWRVALNAIDLAHSAAHDLKILMLNGLIDLPEHTMDQNAGAHAKPNVFNQGVHTTAPEPTDYPGGVNEKLFS